MTRSVCRALVVIAAVWLFAASTTITASPVKAADASAPRAAAPLLPFPRSDRAQAVWASNVCLRDCGAYCAWGQTSCLARDAQGQCLKHTDDCDRYCQRACRTSGGPWLPLDF